MTNWKFSAFFAIALMLIAGLFSTTAMAADGDGSMAITDPAAASDVVNNLEAGSTIPTMTFTYTGLTMSPTSKMDGGLLQMVIPADWVFAAADADGIGAGRRNRHGSKLSGGTTDKTVRVPIGARDDGGNHLKHSRAYPQPPHRW